MLLMHSRRNDGILYLRMQNRSENEFKMHRSWHIYIERTYGKDLHENENKSNIKSLLGQLYREINMGYSEMSRASII